MNMREGVGNSRAHVCYNLTMTERDSILLLIHTSIESTLTTPTVQFSCICAPIIYCDIFLMNVNDLSLFMII